MSTSISIPELEARRDALCRDLASLGDLRPGTLQQRYRKCGKPTCHCARKGDPGHGPIWTLVFAVAGKSKNRVIPEDAVATTQAQIAECKRLRELTKELKAVSEALCQAKLTADQSEAQEAKKGALRPASRRNSRLKSST